MPAEYEIRADFDRETVTVYQAYPPAIADDALSARRIETREELEREVAAWEEERNERGVEIRWVSRRRMHESSSDAFSGTFRLADYQSFRDARATVLWFSR